MTITNSHRSSADVAALLANSNRPIMPNKLLSIIAPITDELDDIITDLNSATEDISALPLTATTFAAATEKTIAAGTIAITQSLHSVDTEGDAASDDLDSITGGTAGQVIVLYPASDARTIVLKHSTSIICPSAQDISLAEDDDYAMLIKKGANWVVIAYKTAANGAGGIGKALAAVTTGLGATLVGIEDANADFTGATVEAALSEIGAYIPRVITDPGNAGAIPITDSGYVPIVTAGAETRTVADPTKVGLELDVFFLTKVGNCVVTFASPVNAAGNNTLTLDTAGEIVTFKSMKDAAGTFAWRVLQNEASTPLSTV